MAKPTLQARYIAALIAHGYRETVDRRYVGCRAFELRTLSKLVFVGRGGSVRLGTNRTNSTPASAAFKAALLKEPS